MKQLKSMEGVLFIVSLCLCLTACQSERDDESHPTSLAGTAWSAEDNSCTSINGNTGYKFSFSFTELSFESENDVKITLYCSESTNGSNLHTYYTDDYAIYSYDKSTGEFYCNCTWADGIKGKVNGSIIKVQTKKGATFNLTQYY